MVQRYLNKISGPLDRIDLQVEGTPVSFEELSGPRQAAEWSRDIGERVSAARKVQAERFKGFPEIYCNAQMPSRMVREVCGLDQTGKELIKQAMERLQLSARAYDRILKVARTSADLDRSDRIEVVHLAEAIQYRSLDREGWAG